MAEDKTPSPLIQLKLINGPASLVLSGGPGLPVRRFVRGKVTIVHDEDEARKLVNAIKRKSSRYQVQEVSKGSVFDLGYDCGVVPSADFRAGLAGLLIGQTQSFQTAFARMLAAGTAALAAGAEPAGESSDDDGGGDSLQETEPAPEPRKKGKSKGGGGTAITSGDVPTVGGE